MRIASIVSAAAMLAFATAGSALAAEPFATLDGIAAEMMTSQAMAGVRGMDLIIDGDDIVAPDSNAKGPLPAEGIFVDIHVVPADRAKPSFVTG